MELAPLHFGSDYRHQDAWPKMGSRELSRLGPAFELEQPPRRTRTYLINGFVVGKPQKRCNENGRKVIMLPAGAVSLPILLYKPPGPHWVNIEPATVKRLSAIDTIVGVKEASGNISK